MRNAEKPGVVLVKLLLLFVLLLWPWNASPLPVSGTKVGYMGHKDVGGGGWSVGVLTTLTPSVGLRLGLPSGAQVAPAEITGSNPLVHRWSLKITTP